MEDIDLKKFLKLVSENYTESDLENIVKAYQTAEYMHKGQYRQSGEPYIIHPLNVGYSLAEMHADSDTVCAGLLHDTLEDTKMTKEGIEIEFNKDVASLVDGVTKISKMNFSSKEEQNIANTSKIINSITEDVRIIIIKLADRLHNMRTLQYKSEFKQKENSLETLEIFTPLANHIGAYRIQNELEDLSLSYLKPDEYKRLKNYRDQIKDKNKDSLITMKGEISKRLNENGLENEIKIRSKNIYSIYRRFQKERDEGYMFKKIEGELRQIHDLLVLRIMVDEIPDCYQALYHVHSLYRPLDSKFKDYICNPKSNYYRSLHTTVFGENERLVQAQIRTFEMDKIASFGLTAYWDIYKGDARVNMQKEIREKGTLYRNLQEISSAFGDSKEFIERVKSEVFTDGTIGVYTPTGEIIKLPEGSTLIDYAYYIGDELGNHYENAYVNDKTSSINYELKNNDRVKIITDSKNTPKEEWIDTAKTTLAKTKIKKYLQNHN